MNELLHQGGHASPPAHVVYPCSPNTRWILYTTHLVVVRDKLEVPSSSIALKDLYRIDFREPGVFAMGFAEIFSAGSAATSPTAGTNLTFPLHSEPGFKMQRQIFFHTLATVAPHVIIQEMDRSRAKVLSQKLIDVRNRASMVAATNKKAELMDQQRAAAAAADAATAAANAALAAAKAAKAERLAREKTIREATAAADIQRSLMRPDGSRAPEPTAIIGSVHLTHFRLYPEAIVVVTSSHAGAVREEIHLDPAALAELQWSKSEDGRGYLRFQQLGSDMVRDDPDDPEVVRCSPGDLQSSLNKIEELYPRIVIRESPLFGQLKSVLASAGGNIKKKVFAALNSVAGFSDAQHLIGTNGHAIALDCTRNRFCVIDLNSSTYRIYQAANLQSVEVFEDSKTLTRHRKDGRGGRALATAGLLVGDAGSMLAGLAGAKAAKSKDQVHELTLRIELGDPKRPIYDVQLFKSANSPLNMGSALHGSLSSDARKWASLLTALIRSAEMNESRSAAPQTAPSAPPPRSVVDELTQLAGLHSSGHLTDDEFTAMKARILE